MCRVLLVEDEPLIALMMETELEEIGCKMIATCATVVDAMSVLDRILPDVAIIDFKLADGDSTRLALALKECGVPFVVVSGTSHENLHEVFEDVEFLSKPVDVSALAEILRRTAGGTRPSPQGRSLRPCSFGA